MTDKERCRLVLVVPEESTGANFHARFEAALSAGDVASVIFPAYKMDETSYQKMLETLVPIAQGAGAAAIANGHTRAFGRSGADGFHVDGSVADIAEAVERYQDKAIVGAGSAESRHKALEIGEARPDYVFFGRFGQDTHPEPHRKNLGLAEWWASMVEIPCIVMAGTDIGSVRAAAQSGAEFVALSRAVLGSDVDAAKAVVEANAILEDFPLEEDA